MRNLGRFAVTIGAAALFVGCGGSQPPISAPGAASLAIVTHSTAPQLKEYPVRNPKGPAYPLWLVFDKQGDLWFNSFLEPYLGERAPSGKVSAHKLPVKFNRCGQEYANGLTLGPNHDVWFTDLCGETLGTVQSDGMIVQKSPFEGSYYSWTADLTSMSGHLWVTMSFGYLAEVNTKWEIVKHIPLPGYYCGPGDIALGYAQTLWIGNSGNCQKITRVTPDGKVTAFAIQAKDGIWEIARGPDGNMWFTAADAPKINAWIGKITPDGQITKYPIAAQPWGIAMGPDGNWWITEPWVGHVISMNLQGQVVDDIKLPHAINGSQPRYQTGEIIQGPDGNMWFGEGLRNSIGELVFSRGQ